MNIFFCRISLLEEKADILADDVSHEMGSLSHSLSNLRNQLLNFEGDPNSGCKNSFKGSDMAVTLEGIEKRLNHLLDKFKSRNNNSSKTDPCPADLANGDGDGTIIKNGLREMTNTITKDDYYENTSYSLPSGWERRMTGADADDGVTSVPYFINHLSETTQWDHPAFSELMDSMAQDLNNIKFAAYRMASKLRRVQTKLRLFYFTVTTLIQNETSVIMYYMRMFSGWKV